MNKGITYDSLGKKPPNRKAGAATGELWSPRSIPPMDWIHLGDLSNLYGTDILVSWLGRVGGESDRTEGTNWL